MENPKMRVPGEESVNAPPQKEDDKRSVAYPDDSIHASHRLIANTCLGAEKTPEPGSSQPQPELESSELLDRVAAVLPGRERNLLTLVRSSYSIAEAARILGIPRGSCAYDRGRIMAYARREMVRQTSFRRRGQQPHPAVRTSSEGTSKNGPSVSMRAPSGLAACPVGS